MRFGLMSSSAGFCTPPYPKLRGPRFRCCSHTGRDLFSRRYRVQRGQTLTATRSSGQILIVFTIVLATIWLATQWTAWRLGLQPQLGPPWFELAGAPVCVPPAFFWWWYHYDAYAPRVVVEGAGIAASGGFASIGIAIAMSVWRAREATAIATYGSARWATKADIAAAGLLGPDGVVLGRFGREYLRHDGPEHVLCFAPTRSGKNRSCPISR
jgi:type IV secretion system protein VirD4